MVMTFVLPLILFTCFLLCYEQGNDICIVKNIHADNLRTLVNCNLFQLTSKVKTKKVGSSLKNNGPEHEWLLVKVCNPLRILFF
jgi:hypothetical protein